MTAEVVHIRRLLIVVVALALALLLLTPTPARAQSPAVELLVTLEFSDGEIDFPVQSGSLHFFDQADAPFLIQILDGCDVNGHYWVFAAGLSLEPVPLTVLDETSGSSRSSVMPAYVPGEPVDAVFDPEALAICQDVLQGGLPPISGTAAYTTATDRCRGFSAPFELSSEGEADAYRMFRRSRIEANPVISERPMATIDDLPDWDELHLFTEGRTPRRVEGVAFTGEQGMLPARSRLDPRIGQLRPARVRRAFEAAKSGSLPDVLMADLGLGSVECVYHVSLQFDTPGAPVYLERAGWIRDGGTLPEPAPPAAERFAVALVSADGDRTALPIVAPAVGSLEEGDLWRHQGEAVMVEIIDRCDLTGSFWLLGAAETDVPIELEVTDRESGQSVTQVLWGEGERPAAVADTSSLTACD